MFSAWHAVSPIYYYCAMGKCAHIPILPNPLSKVSILLKLVGSSVPLDESHTLLEPLLRDKSEVCECVCGWVWVWGVGVWV